MSQISWISLACVLFEEMSAFVFKSLPFIMNFYTVFKRIINDKKFLISIITTATLFKDHLAGHLNSETENQGRKYRKETKPFGCYLSGQASHYT